LEAYLENFLKLTINKNDSINIKNNFMSKGFPDLEEAER
jgi:hypothetical protein